MAYSQTAVERETVISFNDAGDTAEVYTANPVWIRKMDRLCEQNPEQFKPGKVETCEGKVIAKRYTMPKRFITIRAKDKVSTMTEEQRQASAERLAAMRAKQNR